MTDAQQSVGHSGRADRPLVRARAVAKAFSGHAVLHSVDLDLYPGEVVGLLGENGAGKSIPHRKRADCAPASSS